MSGAPRIGTGHADPKSKERTCFSPVDPHLGHADTGVPAVLALLRTDETGFDAILIDLVCHFAPSRKRAASPFGSGLVSVQAAKRRDPASGSRAFRRAS